MGRLNKTTNKLYEFEEREYQLSFEVKMRKDGLVTVFNQL